MKFDNSEAEANFATLSLGLSTYVAGVFSNYEQQILHLKEQLKITSEELAKLKESTVVEKIE